VRFVDTNVWMYAVGRPHPLRSEARALLRRSVVDRWRLVTSAEVLQELFHAYLPVGREQTLDAALRLVIARSDVVALQREDVELARDLVSAHAGLGARDLVHLATATRIGATHLHTFDRGLAAAFG
jgi:predicted nucleic acid-binding protein